MLQLAQTRVNAALMQGFSGPTAEESPPQRVRFAAAELVRQNRLADADMLTYEALRQYPASEDVLVIRALVCEARQDWPAACDALEKLLTLQGSNAPAVSWQHWVRALRCLGDETKALYATQQGMAMHPDDPHLHADLVALQPQDIETARHMA